MTVALQTDVAEPAIAEKTEVGVVQVIRVPALDAPGVS